MLHSHTKLQATFHTLFTNVYNVFTAYIHLNNPHSHLTLAPVAMPMAHILYMHFTNHTGLQENC
jgi:hypothetical protein